MCVCCLHNFVKCWKCVGVRRLAVYLSWSPIIRKKYLNLREEIFNGSKYKYIYKSTYIYTLNAYVYLNTQCTYEYIMRTSLRFLDVIRYIEYNSKIFIWNIKIKNSLYAWLNDAWLTIYKYICFRSYQIATTFGFFPKNYTHKSWNILSK